MWELNCFAMMIRHLHLVSLETMGEDVGLCQLLGGLGALEHLGDQRRLEGDHWMWPGTG